MKSKTDSPMFVKINATFKMIKMQGKYQMKWVPKSREFETDEKYLGPVHTSHFCRVECS